MLFKGGETWGILGLCGNEIIVHLTHKKNSVYWMCLYKTRVGMIDREINSILQQLYEE
ncbi:hypothetical protein D3C73_1488220 [compost metagenome]